mmetsp:Transcript_22333/g.77447  ORF Transcript_22333/g.77447 Transcript_22333/m.77447 type:complete len:221 (+) Transcript_22333:518-1180(+)
MGIPCRRLVSQRGHGGPRAAGRRQGRLASRRLPARRRFRRRRGVCVRHRGAGAVLRGPRAPARRRPRLVRQRRLRRNPRGVPARADIGRRLEEEEPAGVDASCVIRRRLLRARRRHRRRRGAPEPLGPVRDRRDGRITPSRRRGRRRQAAALGLADTALAYTSAARGAVAAGARGAGGARGALAAVAPFAVARVAPLLDAAAAAHRGPRYRLHTHRRRNS